MMKKLIMVLVLISMISIVGCGKVEETKEESKVNYIDQMVEEATDIYNEETLALFVGTYLEMEELKESGVYDNDENFQKEYAYFETSLYEYLEEYNRVNGSLPETDEFVDLL